MFDAVNSALVDGKSALASRGEDWRVTNWQVTSGEAIRGAGVHFLWCAIAMARAKSTSQRVAVVFTVEERERAGK